jgi:hypothetical protein
MNHPDFHLIYRPLKNRTQQIFFLYHNDAEIFRVSSLAQKKTKQAFIARIAEDAANSISTN